MEKRITKRTCLNDILEIVTELGREDLIQYATHELELLDKRAANAGPTKKQKENIELADKLYEALVNYGKPATIYDIQCNCSEFSEDKYSVQKMSALLKKLVDANKVVKVVIKKKVYFSVEK